LKPTTYTARERETTSIPIHDVLDGGVISIFPEVQSKGFFDIRLRGDQLFLSAGKFVGLIPLNEKVLIYVEPKIPVGNLLTLLSRTEGDLATLSILARRYGTSTVLPPSLLEIMAAAFLQDLAHVEIEGLHKDYFEIEENGSAIKPSNFRLLRNDIGARVPDMPRHMFIMTS
jgi:5-methylcytosine-specific restriction enzyme subunit McrC